MRTGDTLSSKTFSWQAHSALRNTDLDKLYTVNCILKGNQRDQVRSPTLTTTLANSTFFATLCLAPLDTSLLPQFSPYFSVLGYSSSNCSLFASYRHSTWWGVYLCFPFLIWVSMWLIFWFTYCQFFGFCHLPTSIRFVLYVLWYFLPLFSFSWLYLVFCPIY